MPFAACLAFSYASVRLQPVDWSRLLRQKPCDIPALRRRKRRAPITFRSNHWAQRYW